MPGVGETAASILKSTSDIFFHKKTIQLLMLLTFKEFRGSDELAKFSVLKVIENLQFRFISPLPIEITLCMTYYV